MKKFIRKSFIFIIILFISSFLVQQLIFLLFRQIEVGEIGVINKIVNGKINADILICGSSRSFVGIDPVTINKITGLKTFNISLNGSRVGIQLQLLKEYLKHNKKPKVIIQEIGFESLTPVNKIYAIYKYLPYLSAQELYNGLKEIDDGLWIQKYIPLSNFMYFNTDFHKMFARDLLLTYSKKRDYLINGYDPRNNIWTIDNKEPIPDIYFNYNAGSKNYITKTIEFCKKFKIKLILVTTPAYYKINQLNLNKGKMIETYSNISEKYNTPFFNYLDIPLSNDRKYFYNFTHLTKNGAEEFSKIISEDLVNNKNCRDFLKTVDN